MHPSHDTAARLAPPAQPDAMTDPAVASPDFLERRDRDDVSALLAGDPEAFRALFRRYAPTALALATRVCRQPALAEETVQEAFLSLWRNPSSFDPGRGSVRSWLMRIVHHRAVDLVRREAAERRRASRAAADPPARAPDAETIVVEDARVEEERRAVGLALGALPPEQRRVIELMYFGGRSQSRIARELGLPLGTVKSRALLGMRRLRAAIGAVRS